MRQRGRQIVDAVHLTPFEGGGDDIGGQSVDVVADGSQRAGEHPVRDQLASLIVLYAVAGERGAAGQAIGERVQRHTAARHEGLVVAQDRLAFGEPGQRVEAVPGQPHHRALLAHPRVVGIGIHDRVGGVDVHRIHRDIAWRFGAHHPSPPCTVNVGTEPHSWLMSSPARITVLSGRTTAAAE